MVAGGGKARWGAVQSRSVHPPEPYTAAIAHEAGWRWRIPLQHREGNGVVFCSEFMSADEARAKLLADIDGEPLVEPWLVKFKTGTRRKAWNRNCVALGLAGGFIEPLESTSIHLMKVAVTRLIEDFPFDGCHEALINRFNRRSRTEFEGIRDFIILHYHQTERDDTGFWRRCRTMDIPDSLAQRIALFRENGMAYQTQDELFRIDSWVQVLQGQRLQAQGHHRVPALLSHEELARALEALRSNIANAVARLPRHPDFLARYCPAEPI